MLSSWLGRARQPRGASRTAGDFARRTNELLIFRWYFRPIGKAVLWCSPCLGQRGGASAR